MGAGGGLTRPGLPVPTQRLRVDLHQVGVALLPTPGLELLHAPCRDADRPGCLPLDLLVVQEPLSGVGGPHGLLPPDRFSLVQLLLQVLGGLPAIGAKALADVASWGVSLCPHGALAALVVAVASGGGGRGRGAGAGGGPGT